MPITCESCGAANTSGAHLAELARRAELELIDRAWQIERGRYVSDPNHGTGVWAEPNGPAALAAGALVAAFGGLWVWLALAIGGPPVLTLLGMAVVLAAVGGGVYGWLRAGQYWSAKQEYESRRAVAAGDHAPTS